MIGYNLIDELIKKYNVSGSYYKKIKKKKRYIKKFNFENQIIAQKLPKSRYFISFNHGK